LTTEHRCAWDGHRTINDLSLGGSIDRASQRWILESVDDGGSSARLFDPRLDVHLAVVDNVVVDITCWTTFFVPGHAANLIGAELWEVEAAVGHPFTPDAVASDLIFEAVEVGLSCIVDDGRVSCISLSDFDLIDEDTPNAPRPVGAG
jgi:hypothetical protein